MALDPNRWTLKTQEAFNAAVEAARASSNPEVTPDHLLAALLGQDEGVVLPVLEKVGVPPLALRNAADDGRGQAAQGLRRRGAALGRELQHVLEAADARPRRARRRVPVDRAPAARDGVAGGVGDSSRLGVTTTLLDALQRGARQPPRHQREPRGAVPGAREVRPRPHRGRPARASSTRSSGATRRSAASSRCCRGARRTTRCSSASPASARPRSSRASPGASSRATCPRACSDKRLIALDIGVDGRRREVPRRVRGAAQGRAQGDHRLRRRGHHVHRRAAHDRRRRRRRGRDGRRQHDQADARPRRAAHDRRHHARRVPQVHREGRRARAPLPAGLRRASRRSRTRSPSCAG